MPQFSDDLFLGPAQTHMGTGIRPYTTTVTGTIASTTLTVTAVNQGAPIVVGMYVDGGATSDGTYITGFGTGTGGVGTYTLNQVSTVSSAVLLTLHGNINFDNPAPMDLGVGPVGRVYIWDLVPQTLNTANIVGSVTPAAAGSLTLAASASTKSVVRQDGVSVIQLDCPRAVSVTQVTAGNATAFTITGYDYYGQPMSEVITSVAAATTAGLKAFYQISSVSVAGATGTAVTVGTSNVFGIPVRVFNAGYVSSVKWNSTLAADAGTFVAANTATATTATGDVRGTYTPSNVADGIKRLVMTIALPAIAVGPNATRVGALGVNQNLVS